MRAAFQAVSLGTARALFATCPAPARGSLLEWRRRGRAMPTIVPPCMTAIRSLMPRISGSSDEIIRMASPRPASSLMSRWISALAPTSTPWVGSSRMSSAGLAASQRASATFCWFPPERLPTGVSSEAVLIPSWRTKPAAISRSRRKSRNPNRETARRVASVVLAGRRHVEDDAVAAAVFGDVGDSQGGRARRRIDRHGRPRSRTSPVSAGVRPNKTRASSVRPAPTSPASPRISPARTLKRDVAHARRPAPQIPYLEDHLARLDECLGKDRRQLAADHHADQVAARHLVHAPGPDQHAVAQGRHAIGDLRQLFEAVGNVDDADAVRLQVADDPEEPVDLLVAQRGRRLVHDQDAGFGPQGPRDLDQLLLGHRQRADLGFRVDRRADFFEQVSRLSAPPAPADPAPASARLEPDRDVLGDRQVRKERRLLVNRGDSQVACAHRIEVADRPALDLDRSLVGQMGAGDHLDQRRFARAVFADQGVDFSGPEVERDPLQGVHAGKRLADSGQLQQRRHSVPS